MGQHVSWRFVFCPSAVVADGVPFPKSVGLWLGPDFSESSLPLLSFSARLAGEWLTGFREATCGEVLRPAVSCLGAEEARPVLVDPLRLTGERCALTLFGDFLYSVGCCVETWTRRLLELWKLFPQCLQRARSHLRGVAVDVGEHFTWC